MKSLDIFRTIHGENHPDVATSYHSVGSVYGSQGNFDKALEYHLKSVGILISVSGEHQSQFTSTFNSLGLASYD